MNTLLRQDPRAEVDTTNFLSEWIRNGTLVSLILDAAQTLEWPETDLRLAASSGYAFRRLALLSVVTYCYAAGIYHPKDIAQRVSRDEILGFLCAGTFPTSEDIRMFTRRNRGLIRQSLRQTYKLAREYGLRAGTLDPANCQRTDSGDHLTRVDLELQLAEGEQAQVEPSDPDDMALLAR